MVKERDLQGKGPSSILGGGFLFFNRNTSNNNEVFQYQFETFLGLLKRAATVYESEIYFGDTLRCCRISNQSCAKNGVALYKLEMRARSMLQIVCKSTAILVKYYLKLKSESNFFLQTFDLKGSMRSRYVQTSGMKNDVLLDENLLESE